MSTAISDSPEVESETSATPLAVIFGAVLVPMIGGMQELDSDAMTWATVVPVDEPEGAYPRESYIPIRHVMHVGTAEELAEHIRQQLLAAETAVFHGRDDFLAKNNEAISGYVAKEGPIPVDRPIEADDLKLVDRHEQRCSLRGVPVRQDGRTRDLLLRLVANYASEASETATPPCEEIEGVQKLIDALVMLKEDLQAVSP